MFTLSTLSIAALHKRCISQYVWWIGDGKCIYIYIDAREKARGGDVDGRMDLEGWGKMKGGSKGLGIYIFCVLKP